VNIAQPATEQQTLEKLERDLDAQGVTDPDYREYARVTLGKVLIEAETASKPEPPPAGPET